MVVDDASALPLEAAAHSEKPETTREVLGSLNPREALVLCTLDEVGRRLMVTNERIRQIEKKAISKLARNPQIKHLADSRGSG